MFFLTGVIFDRKWVSDGVELELFVLELFGFESSFDCLYVGEVSSELFFGIEWNDVGFLLFGLLFVFLGWFLLFGFCFGRHSFDFYSFGMF